MGETAMRSPAVDAVRRAIDAAVEHILSMQNDRAGYWWAELESNVTITAEHLFLRHVLRRPDADEAREAARSIRGQQRADGTWSNWQEGPADLSTTVEAYTALKMAGVDSDDPAMHTARQYILAQGGVENVRVFTKIWLAMMGEWEWRGIPVVPPELFLLPDRFPVNLYSFGCWARQTVGALTIVMNERPVVPLPADARIDELFARGRENVSLRIRPSNPTLIGRLFLVLDRILHAYDRMPWKPLRKRALAKAERWILDRQEADGSWGGIQPPWVYSLIALKLRGHTFDDPDGPLARGFAGFYGETGFAVSDETGFRLQSCLSPVWDTALALMALADADVAADHPAIVRAAEWLLDEQVFTGGDWQVRCNARPGGWAFEFANDVYPDVDDTAAVIMGLQYAAADANRVQMAIDRGVEWMVGMRSRCGGWGAFDRNNTQTWTRKIPFADFGEMIDPPSADVSGHAVECLGRLGRRIGDPIVDRAVAYLLAEQEADGTWYGRWGVNLTYGTGAVLPGLEAVGFDMASSPVRRAVEWLVRHQNEDGGWGEKIEGYYDAAWRGRGPSTASQTGWAVMALLAAESAGHPAIQRGIDYLLRTQRADGGWDEVQYTGTGFPTDFMIRYNIYRDVFPLMALGRYRRKAGESA